MNHLKVASLDAALAHLCAADPVLGCLIEQIGPYALQRDPNHFYALLSSIVAQQISVRAAATIMGRVEALFPIEEGITAEGALAAGPDTAATGVAGVVGSAIMSHGNIGIMVPNPNATSGGAVVSAFDE